MTDLNYAFSKDILICPRRSGLGHRPPTTRFLKERRTYGVVQSPLFDTRRSSQEFDPPGRELRQSVSPPCRIVQQVELYGSSIAVASGCHDRKSYTMVTHQTAYVRDRDRRRCSKSTELVRKSAAPYSAACR